MADALEYKIEQYGRSAISNLRGMIKALIPALGSRMALSITTEELTEWLRRRGNSQQWENATYNTYVTQLKVMYRLGAESGKVKVNPTSSLKRRTLDKERPRYLTEDEEARMEKALEAWPQHRCAYLFAKHIGVRAGFQFNLKWSQVDLKNRTFTLPTKKNSKYKKHRVRPLNDIAFEVLAARFADRGASPLVFHEHHRRAYLTKPANWFPPIVKAAGLGSFTWHSLRHDFASQLVMKSNDLVTV